MDLTLARYNGNGTLDNTFGTNGIVITDAGGYERIESIAISNNKLYAAGTDGTNPAILLE
ncbi:MAG TPA: hypothetical protein VGP55_02160 [Chitinophagaceae bacterium]|nr:hypothetical protein [Chitinophagaceae bacterium]